MKTSAWSPQLLSVLRIMSGLLFLEHGTSKLLGFPPSPMPGPFHLFSMVGFSGVLEFVGGILLAIGLFTRITAFILSGEMAVAYFMVHWALFGPNGPHSFFPLVNRGELAVVYCFVFLYLAAAGGGPWSLDRLRHRG
jgi:putative oxidoreductase